MSNTLIILLSLWKHRHWCVAISACWERWGVTGVWRTALCPFAPWASSWRSSACSFMLYDLCSVNRNLWWKLSFFDFQIHFQSLVKVDIIMQNFFMFHFYLFSECDKRKSSRLISKSISSLHWMSFLEIWRGIRNKKQVWILCGNEKDSGRWLL